MLPVDRVAQVTSALPWRGTWKGYLFAAGLSAGILLLKLGLRTYLGFESPFLLFPLAVILSAWFGGAGPGLLATALTSFCSALFFIEPIGVLEMTAQNASEWAVFTVQSLFICWFASAIQQVRDRLQHAYYALFTQLVERQRAEAELRALNETLEHRVAERTRELELRNRELQSFAFVASHDLQEPLRKVQLFAGLLREDFAARLDETALAYLERIEQAGARMSHLLTEVLAYSRVTTRTQPFLRVNVQETAEAVAADLDVLLAETDARLDVVADVWIEADPGQLRQVLLHLLTNAIKYRQDGVPPHVRVTATLEPVHGDGELAAPPRCRLVVDDNGIGFDEVYRERIFEPFERLHGRANYPGTGMGLAICRRIVERHRGTITAESSPGTGSRFTVLLPVHQAHR